SFIGPLLASIALDFGPAEYFSLVLLGLIMAVYLSEGSALKGLMMATVGLLIGTVGIDPVLGVERFTFGVPRLTDGFDFVVVAMGLFGIDEVLSNLESPEHRNVFKSSIKGLLPTLDDWRRSWGAVTRGSLIGFFVGVLPGGGATISSFVAYALEKRLSKHPEQFGKGVIEGVAAPESANNAASTSSFIPLLTLGIPANATMALMFGALLIQGVTPGPQLVSQHPDLFWGVVNSMYIGNILLLIMSIPLVGLFVRILRVRAAILAPITALIT